MRFDTLKRFFGSLTPTIEGEEKNKCMEMAPQHSSSNGLELGYLHPDCRYLQRVLHRPLAVYVLPQHSRKDI